MYELFNGHQGRFEDAVSMSKPVFLMLCDTLHSFGLTLPQREHGVPLEEKVAIFICVLQGMKMKDLQERFQHSKETLSQHFHKVLKVMIPFTAVHSRSFTPEHDCIGALDGTHVMARVSEEYATSYYGRKGVPTQNMLAVCDFDLCFTFVSAGWDGSMHDSRVLHYVTTEPKHRFPHPAPGKYYLVDSGYSNKTGYLAPYKGYRYHQNAHRNRRPQNEFELFNKAHSSLRSCIERTFGAWKSRWGALRNIQKLSFSNQVIFVCASMALHNFIHRNSEIDEVTVPIANSTEYVAPEMPDHDKYARVADVIEEGDSDPAMTVSLMNYRKACAYTMKIEWMKMKQWFENCCNTMAMFQRNKWNNIKGWAKALLSIIMWFSKNTWTRMKEIFIIDRMVAILALGMEVASTHGNQTHNVIDEKVNGENRDQLHINA
ncbi:uncharacterized protein LOC114286365 [Camellia sinensis]|uniref:uncharacterized protein LOC114286365 n=1 Tax=Camellia sinensis TaxID=4442 RepID=UPI001036C3C5|nr:uncharacterized protein LOC114286365 [Camellia sinensis]